MEEVTDVGLDFTSHWYLGVWRRDQAIYSYNLTEQYERMTPVQPLPWWLFLALTI